MSTAPRDPLAAKAALRRDLRRARRALSPDARRAAHEAIARSISELVSHLGSASPTTAPVLALYAARPDEVDLGPLVPRLAHGTRLAWPRVDGPVLGFVEAHPEDLVPGYRGLLEPAPALPTVEPTSLSLILVPGLGFDLHGARLGSGGGHYDRTLADPAFADALLVGVAYACQLVPSLPVEPHDVRMHAVVTDLGLVPLDPRTRA